MISPVLGFLRRRVLLVLAGLLILSILAVFGVWWWMARQHAELVAKTDKEISRLENQVLNDALAFEHQNREIDRWKNEAALVAAAADQERRVQEGRLALTRKEVELLRGMPLPEAPEDFRKITDPLLLEMAQAWEVKR